MHPFRYHRAATVDQAADLLETLDDGALLAGGMTLIPTLKQRLAAPSDLIDLGRIPGLAGVTREADGLRIGAMTRHVDVADDGAVGELFPGLAALARAIGDLQVRNRGTIGGSIANADPAADYPAGLLGLDAIVRTNRRDLAAQDFFTGFFETALGQGEIVTSIFFPAPQPCAYAKFRNPASGYAVVGAFVARPAGGVRVAITGAAGSVFRWRDAEAALSEEFSVEALAGLAADPAAMNSDMHASSDFRAHLVGAMTRKAVEALLP